jgi:hypothetical protein
VRLTLQSKTLLSQHRDHVKRIKYTDRDPYETSESKKGPPRYVARPVKAAPSQKDEEARYDSERLILKYAPTVIAGVPVDADTIIALREGKMDWQDIAKEIGVSPASLSRAKDEWNSRVGNKLKNFENPESNSHHRRSSFQTDGSKPFVPDRLRWLLEDVAYAAPGARLKISDLQDKMQRSMPRGEPVWSKQLIVWELDRLGYKIDHRTKTLHVCGLALTDRWGNQRITVTTAPTEFERWELVGLANMRIWRSIRRAWRRGDFETVSMVSSV